MYLTGAKQFNLDAKARLTLPASYRKEFGGQVVLIPLQDAVYGFTPEGFGQWVDGFFQNNGKEYEPRDRKQMLLRRKFTASAVTVDVDSAGRIALGKVPAAKRAGLGLERDVTVVGVVDHFEVWNTQRWEAMDAALDDELDALMYGEGGE